MTPKTYQHNFGMDSYQKELDQMVDVDIAVWQEDHKDPEQEDFNFDE